MHQNDQKQVICEIYGILDKHINVQIGFSMLNALEYSFLSDPSPIIDNACQ